MSLSSDRQPWESHRSPCASVSSSGNRGPGAVAEDLRRPAPGGWAPFKDPQLRGSTPILGTFPGTRLRRDSEAWGGVRLWGAPACPGGWRRDSPAVAGILRHFTRTPPHQGRGVGTQNQTQARIGGRGSEGPGLAGRSAAGDRPARAGPVVPEACRLRAHLTLWLPALGERVPVQGAASPRPGTGLSADARERTTP